MDIEKMAQNAHEAYIELASLSSEIKNKALLNISTKLNERKAEIFEANKYDIERSENENLASPLLKRLKFDENKLKDITNGIKSLIALPDPCRQTLMSTELDDDLSLYKVSCPIGVIGIIFESRPDALIQISTLCLKSGNVAILKGGSEALESNKILYEIIKNATVDAGIPENWINLLQTRDEISEILKLHKYIDLLIPRGSNQFVQYIMNNTKIPVLGHADGICHVYVDRNADIDKAVKVCTDSKTQSVAVCNAAETFLVDQEIAKDFLPLLKKALEEKNVVIYGCPKTRSIIDVKAATHDDWKTEYLDYKISIKVVSDISEAVEHINKYGSKHTDCIVTEDKAAASKFMSLVDSGNVFLNCSTRFSDGFRYGFGAEVGISTSKIHARGPVGLEGLVIYKYMLIGNGNIVEDYAAHKKTFTHIKSDKEFPL